MTNTMIERVAKAISAVLEEPYGIILSPDARMVARVAIAAMREPTPEQDAAFESDLGWMADTEMGNTQRAAWLEENRKRWRMMIDSALGRKGNG